MPVGLQGEVGELQQTASEAAEEGRPVHQYRASGVAGEGLRVHRSQGTEAAAAARSECHSRQGPGLRA